MTIGLVGNPDGSGAISIGGSPAIDIAPSLDVTLAQDLTVTGAQTVGGSLTVTGALNVSGGVTGSIKSATAVSASGTSVDFTSIPSWVKRITVMFNGVSTNGTSNIQIQVGAGSVTTTGYSGGISQAGATSNQITLTTGLGITATNAAALSSTGTAVFSLLGSNIWVGTSTTSRSDGYGQLGGTVVTLSGTLDRVRITTVNGTDTFDAGSINILYE